MEVMKSKAVQRAEAAAIDEVKEPAFAVQEKQVGALVIKPLRCYNEFVILVQLPKDTNIALPAGAELEQRAVVVGTGPGLPTANGCRCPSQLKIGSTVMFQKQSILYGMEPIDGVYAGKHLIVLSERNIVMDVKQVPVEIVEDDPASLDCTIQMTDR